MSRMRATLPPNVKLIRQKSAWNNSTLFAEVIVWLAAALAPWMDALQPILSFDAHKLHLAPCVFAACFLYNIWPLVIPPSTTWFMQPLDVDGFSLFKLTLRGLFQSARAEARCSEALRMRRTQIKQLQSEDAALTIVCYAPSGTCAICG